MGLIYGPIAIYAADEVFPERFDEPTLVMSAMQITEEDWYRRKITTVADLFDGTRTQRFFIWKERNLSFNIHNALPLPERARIYLWKPDLYDDDVFLGLDDLVHLRMLV